MSSDLELSKWHCLRKASLVDKTTEPKGASTHGMIDMTLAKYLDACLRDMIKCSGNNSQRHYVEEIAA